MPDQQTEQQDVEQCGICNGTGWVEGGQAAAFADVPCSECNIDEQQPHPLAVERAQKASIIDRLARENADLRAACNEYDRLRPVGSPPPGGWQSMAAWTVKTVMDATISLNVKLAEAERERDSWRLRARRTDDLRDKAHTGREQAEAARDRYKQALEEIDVSHDGEKALEIARAALVDKRPDRQPHKHGPECFDNDVQLCGMNEGDPQPAQPPQPTGEQEGGKFWRDAVRASFPEHWVKNLRLKPYCVCASSEGYGDAVAVAISAEWADRIADALNGHLRPFYRHDDDSVSEVPDYDVIWASSLEKAQAIAGAAKQSAGEIEAFIERYSNCIKHCRGNKAMEEFASQARSVLRKLPQPAPSLDAAAHHPKGATCETDTRASATDAASTSPKETATLSGTTKNGGCSTPPAPSSTGEQITSSSTPTHGSKATTCESTGPSSTRTSSLDAAAEAVVHRLYTAGALRSEYAARDKCAEAEAFAVDALRPHWPPDDAKVRAVVEAWRAMKEFGGWDDPDAIHEAADVAQWIKVDRDLRTALDELDALALYQQQQESK